MLTPDNFREKIALRINKQSPAMNDEIGQGYVILRSSQRIWKFCLHFTPILLNLFVKVSVAVLIKHSAIKFCPLRKDNNSCGDRKATLPELLRDDARDEYPQDGISIAENFSPNQGMRKILVSSGQFFRNISWIGPIALCKLYLELVAPEGAFKHIDRARTWGRHVPNDIQLV